MSTDNKTAESKSASAASDPKKPQVAAGPQPQTAPKPAGVTRPPVPSTPPAPVAPAPARGAVEGGPGPASGPTTTSKISEEARQKEAEQKADDVAKGVNKLGVITEHTKETIENTNKPRLEEVPTPVSTDGLKTPSGEPSPEAQKEGYSEKNQESSQEQYVRQAQRAMEGPNKPQQQRAGAQRPPGQKQELHSVVPTKEQEKGPESNPTAWIPTDTLVLFLRAIQHNHDSTRAALKSVLR